MKQNAKVEQDQNRSLGRRRSRWAWPCAVACALGVLAAQPEESRASVPSAVAFTGIVSDGNGPIDGNVSLAFALYTSAVGGNAVWSEQHSAAADQGLVMVELGGDVPLDELVFDGSLLYLEVSVNGEVLGPRSEVASVPYAIRAGEADRVGGLGASDLQERVTGTCPGAITAINADGTVMCESGVYALAGHNHDASYAPIAHNHDASYAPIAHNHDAQYYTKAELDSAGVVNNAANPVQWTKLKGVPASFADGVDNDSGGDITQVTAGAGLTGGAASGVATLSVSFAGNGLANTCARSDHNHDADYIQGTGGGINELKAGTASALAGSGTINFPGAFGSTPVVTITPFQPGGGVSCQITAVNAASFSFSCNGNGGTLQWIAVD